jgi:NAD(P)-dependent dehydrogenase (short-subunit alcohol dehydrogenase family)
MANIKTVLLTGSSTGIGKETALALAKWGHTVVMVSRDPARAKAAQEAIKAEVMGSQIESIPADLSLMSEVRRVATEVKNRFPKIDVLINCAAIVTEKRQVTSEGIEQTFATNVVGNVLLVHELTEKLKASAPSRIVNFYGGNAKTIDFDDLQSAKGKFSGWNAYGQSKLCIGLLTVEQARRFADTKVTVNCAWPGIVNTEGMRSLTGGMKAFAILTRPLMRTPAEGTQTPMYVALSPDLEGVNGKFYGTMFGDGKKELVPPPVATDPEAAKRLYAICEKLAGL